MCILVDMTLIQNGVSNCSSLSITNQSEDFVASKMQFMLFLLNYEIVEFKDLFGNMKYETTFWHPTTTINNFFSFLSAAYTAN